MKNVLKILALAAAGLGLVVGLTATFRVGAPPVLQIGSVSAIGVRTTVVVTASAPGRGLSSVSLELVQGDRTHVIEERRYRARPAWAFWGERTESDEIQAEVGRGVVPDLQPGEAVLRVIGGREPTWLLHRDPVVQEITVPVRLIPPDLSVLSIHNYATQGGAGVVVYRVGDTTARDGVRAGQWFFPGNPLPEGGPGDRLCLFGIPWDLGDDAEVRLVAEDDIGNLAEQAFLDRFFPKPPAADRIGLTDSFMARVVPEIQRRTPELTDRGNLLENYLQINGDLRRQNGATLVELARDSSPAFLWTEPFVSLPGAQVMSSFADQRTYTYQGQAVDEQTHLGYDLASISHAPVPAANRGVVRLARYFGIYGNTVVIDHGYGLMSLYSHLSSIEVEEGQEVGRGATVGRTGATGLAGGDHLHFTTLIRGLPVNPTEWWDASWIRDRVARKLGPVLPFDE